MKDNEVEVSIVFSTLQTLQMQSRCLACVPCIHLPGALHTEYREGKKNGKKDDRGRPGDRSRAAFVRGFALSVHKSPPPFSILLLLPGGRTTLMDLICPSFVPCAGTFPSITISIEGATVIKNQPFHWEKVSGGGGGRVVGGGGIGGSARTSGEGERGQIRA